MPESQPVLNAIERVVSLDLERVDIMIAIIDSRRRLIEFVDDEQWEKVFELFIVE